MSFALIHIVSVLQGSGRKDKSPILDDVSPGQPLRTDVNPLQELARISIELFGSPSLIPWDARNFGVDNNGVPLYISYQDVIEILSGSQMINIGCIQLWMM